MKREATAEASGAGTSASGALDEEARKLADWVRGAAITSRQYDVTYAKKLARNL